MHVSRINIRNNSEFILSDAGKKALEKLNDKFYKVLYYEGRKLIYISGPATGIENYQDIFDEICTYLQEYCDLDKYYIFNPMLELDNMPEDVSYIDKTIIITKILNVDGHILIIDDRTDKWKSSKGCLVELAVAFENGLRIISYSKLLKGECEI